MRVLLIGANGQLGRELRASLVSLGDLACATREGRLGPDFHACEVADLDYPSSLAELLDRVAPDIVVNAAAYTAVDRAEGEQDIAFRINVEAVEALAIATAAHGALLVHYSTDYVFPGDDPRPRREDDLTGPLNVYGASKLASEEAVRASGCRHMIFRISWVYSAHGRNFLRTMLRLAKEREEVRVVCDQIGAPTPAHWIAKASALAIARHHDHGGIWHLAAAGETSWHGFARAIFAEASQAGLIERKPRLVPVPSSEYPVAAKRPGSSRLNTGKLERDFGIALPDWRQGLAEVISQVS